MATIGEIFAKKDSSRLFGPDFWKRHSENQKKKSKIRLVIFLKCIVCGGHTINMNCICNRYYGCCKSIWKSEYDSMPTLDEKMKQLVIIKLAKNQRVESVINET